MKRPSSIILLKILFLLFALEVFAKDEREVRQVPTPPPPQPSRTQNRPILPPQVPTLPPTVSPTPSPHIAIPPTDATLMMRQTAIPMQPQVGLPAMQEIPPVPIIGNTIGKVLSIGSDEEGTLFIEVDDTLFGTTFRVKINPRGTGIVKANRILKLSEIGIGDTVNVLYTEKAGEKIATFISVLTPEEIELMEQIESETVAKPEELMQEKEPTSEESKTEN